MSKKTNQEMLTSPFTKILCSDKVLRAILCLCFGILPFGFKKHSKKLKYSLITLIMALCHVCCFLSYMVFINTYWSDNNYGPVMPGPVKVIQSGLVAAGAFNLALFSLYLYSKDNNFSDCGGRSFQVIPRIKFALEGEPTSPFGPRLKQSDWLSTNFLLLFGFFCSSFVIFVDFRYNTFYSFHGIHDFVKNISTMQKLHYHISVSTEFFGFFATVAAICVFHVITRDLIRHIDETECFIINSAKNLDDFQKAHDALYRYGKGLLQSIKWWFNTHTMFFFFLVTAMVFEWFTFIERDSKELGKDNWLMLSQISGSLLISFKFAFPFISASRVTERYSLFYYTVARKSRIKGLPHLSMLQEQAGIKIIGIPITTKFAVIAFFCSFLGAFRLVTGWKEE